MRRDMAEFRDAPGRIGQCSKGLHPAFWQQSAQVMLQWGALSGLLACGATAHAQSSSTYSYARSLPPIPPPTIIRPGVGTSGTSAVGTAAQTSAKARPRKLALLEPADGRIYHGASLPDTWSQSGLQRQMAAYQAVAGRKISVVTWFGACYHNGRLTSWRNDYLPALRRVQAAGAISLIKLSAQDDAYARTKKMADPRDIVRGVYDAYFEDAAEVCRDFGGPLWISWCHEMNGNWYPYSQEYGPDAPEARQWVGAWQHIVRIFRERKATNVAWMWSPNVPDVGAIKAQDYYPGDDYVDWIGASFYSGNPLSNLDDFYDRWADRKPIFINEWATGESKNRYYVGFPGEATWVTDLLQALQQRYPRVKGISWFQWNKADGDYLLQRVPSQQKAYAEAVASARYIDNVPAPPTPPTPVRQSTGQEVVLSENPSDAGPAIESPAREQVRREAPRTESVKREQVKRG